jgi:bifunctional oligoribonuclease and PAP phosphatase NrnA
MFIELKHGFKVSFRSKGVIPVHRLAAEFGGGGHTNASGARILKGNLKDFINIVLERAEKYLEL